jgi:hypothetical protein
MNKRLYHYTGLRLLLFSCLFSAFYSCKKVEKNDEFLHSIYSVMTSGILYRENNSFFSYEYTSATTGKSLVPGDTLTIAGILGGSHASREIMIGDSVVRTFNPGQYRIREINAKDTIWTNVDYIQCRIPAGVANNSVPVTIIINGSTINAPALKIQEYSSIPSATDTTLIVEKVAEWLPANADAYKNGYSPYDLWTDGTVTNNGNIWFYNQIGGIFKVENSTVQQVLAPGESITAVNGDAFSIVSIIGFTVDIDETVVYFSASTTENTADATQYYITRLCKMDPVSRRVEVLNRSTFMKTTAQYPRAADLSTILYDPANNYLPAEGSVADTKMALGYLFIALDGTLFASNFAYRTNTFPKSFLADDPRFPQFSDPAFYAGRDSINAASWYAEGKISSGMNNFVRIRNGSVRSLAKPVADWPVPALTVYNYFNQQISPDGKYIYDMNTQQALLSVISTEDFEEDVKGIPGYEFSFSSLDSSDATGWHAPTMSFQSSNFGNFYILANGDGVFFPGGYGYPGLSLLGINFGLHNAYVYAGTEKGLQTGEVPAQNQATGLAKWVNFDPTRRGINGKNSFVGFDRRNQLYFISTATEGFISDQQHLPLEIYRIRKP